MIPNHAPMAAVYLDGSRLVSLPVVAWNDDDGCPLVPGTHHGLIEANRTVTGGLLGLWHHGWSPSYDEMASLLPEHTPGTPHPLATPVVVRESQSGWTAYRTENNSRLASRPTLDELTALLGSVGNFHVEKIVTADEE